MPTLSQRLFRTLSRITFALTFLVILAGSIVRVTQSGMGCPDWPKCFGYYSPPTENYQVEFHPDHSYGKGIMIIANDTLWRATENFTSNEAFDRSNWEKYPKHNYATFVSYQTWIEYINRLLGAVLGVLVLGMFLTSFSFKRVASRLIWLSFFLLILTGFQGWLGALVVSSNLAPVKITVHMLAALLLLAVVQLILHRLDYDDEQHEEQVKNDGLILPLALISLIFTIIQVITGTQVREEIDVIASSLNHSQRELWIDGLSNIFVLHRAFSLIVLAVNAALVYKVFQSENSQAVRFAVLAGLLVLAEVIVGITLSFFDVPAVAQPIHLLLASMLFAAQFGVLLNARKIKKTST